MDFDVFGLVKQLFDAVMGGNFALVAALALVLIVFVLRKFVGPKVPFLASDAGGVVLAFLSAFGGALATAFGAHAAFSLALLFKAAQVAFLAMGGYAALKKLLGPALDALLQKLGLKAKAA